MKIKNAERHLINCGYTIEWVYSPKGTQVCKAIKDGQKTIYARTLISLEKKVFETYNE